ncbi:MAG: rRNA maturation RNase YbeY [Planctomycetota bacterium]|nr:MAG: rRNA maturation RNase YbeY [Planctomycetota bacterium]
MSEANAKLAVRVAEGLSFEAELGSDPEGFCQPVLAELWAQQQRELALSIYFATDVEIAEIHGSWLGDPSATDVISFPLREDAHSVAAFDGELIVGYEHARRVSSQLNGAFASELALYVVHGALHLLGYDDHCEEDLLAMKAAEQSVLSALGYAVPDRYES